MPLLSQQLLGPLCCTSLSIYSCVLWPYCCRVCPSDLMSVLVVSVFAAVVTCPCLIPLQAGGHGVVWAARHLQNVLWNSNWGWQGSSVDRRAVTFQSATTNGDGALEHVWLKVRKEGIHERHEKQSQAPERVHRSPCMNLLFLLKDRRTLCTWKKIWMFKESLYSSKTPQDLTLCWLFLSVLSFFHRSYSPLSLIILILPELSYCYEITGW